VEYTVSTSLRLNTSQFTAGLGVAAGQVKVFGRTTAGVMQAAGTSALNAGKSFAGFANNLDASMKRAGTSLSGVSTGVGVMGAGMLAGFAVAAGAALRFDKQMSEVGAVANASASELGMLRQAALDAGQATVFSASEAAQAEAELAKAGVATADILSGGLRGALDLAAAGSLGLGEAAEIAAEAMTTFGLSGSDVPRIADVIAAAANKSAADVGGLAQAMRQSGLVAAQMGLTVEDTAGALALFSQSGLKGSDAGTSLKTMLMRLNPSSAEAAGLMKQLGISFFDAQGRFIGLEGTAQVLQDRLGGLTQQQRLAAQSTIFGADAIRASNILYSAGAQGVRTWTGQVTDAGYAARLAAEKTNNLAGDLEQLRGSIETALIKAGSQATGVLREMTQSATGVVNWVGNLPAPVQSAGMAFAALGGSALLAVGVLGKIAPSISSGVQLISQLPSLLQTVALRYMYWSEAMRANIATQGVMKTTMSGLGAALTSKTFLLGVVGAAVMGAAQAFDEGKESAKKFIEQISQPGQFDATSVDSMNERLAKLRDRYDEVQARHKAQRDGILDWGSAIADVFIPVHNLEDSLLDTKGAMDALNEELEASEMAAKQWEHGISGAAGAVGISIAEAADWFQKLDLDPTKMSFPEYVSAIQEARGATLNTSPVVGELAGGLKDMASSTSDADDKLKGLKTALDAIYTGVYSIPEAVDRYRGSLNDLAEAAKAVNESGGGFIGFADNFSDEAIRMRDAIRTSMGEAGGVLEALAGQVKGGTLSIGEMRFAVESMAAQWETAATAAGLPNEEIRRGAEFLRSYPDKVAVPITTPGVKEAIADGQTLNGELATAALGADGLITVPGADGSTATIVGLNGQLYQVKQGAAGPVSVPGADGSTWQVSLVNGQLQVVKQGAHGVVTLDTSNAESKITGLQRMLGTVRATASNTYIPGISVFQGANGGVLDFAAYANGGIRAAERYANGGEHHVAQIARPGTTRIWNEPETGGEAYIPMAASKRPRALQVLNMVADRFSVAGGGGTVVHLSISAPIHAPGADSGSVRAIRRELELVIDGATDRIARNLLRRDRKIT
jgi:TP901 family phage tail tape measure protein